jgi:hypothetical protein
MPFAGSRSRIPESAKTECEFLESVLPVKSFVHLTTRHRMTSDHLKSIFRAWILEIQKHHRVTVEWVRSIEHFPKLHIHAALVAPVPIDCNYAAATWQSMAAPGYPDAAIVEPYRKGRCGMGYVLKQLECPANTIQFSENILAFADGIGKSRFPTTPANRRQQRRIKAQLERALMHIPIA